MLIVRSVALYLLISCLLFGGWANSSIAATQFWLTQSNSIPPGSSPPGDSGATVILERPVGAADQQIQIWMRPETGKILKNISFNLIASTPEIIQWKTVQIHNDLIGEDIRFEALFDTNSGLEPATEAACGILALSDEGPPEDALWGVKGINFFEPSDGLGIGGNPADDLGYDATNDAYHFATATFDVTAAGQTDLYLQIGELGMSYEGEGIAEFDAIFGAATDASLNGDTGRCLNSSTPDGLIRTIDSILGDFNFNGSLDDGDIDLLSQAVRTASTETMFDVSGDGFINQLDREVWIENLFGTIFGDVNLDFQVGFADFTTLAGNWGKAGGWSQGDVSGNGLVQFEDFATLAGNWGQIAGVEMTQAVPEPHGFGSTLVGLALLLLRNRCRIFG